MAKPQDLKFKPYVGHFFQFTERVRKNPKNAIIGHALYGNQIKKRKNISSLDNIPQSILVVDEKRNHIKFLGPSNEYYWTTKAQIEPIDLPTYSGNPIPILQEFRNFLAYCTDTRIMDFSIEVMTKRAIDLLPKVDSMIEKYKFQILPK